MLKKVITAVGKRVTDVVGMIVAWDDVEAVGRKEGVLDGWLLG